jgi:hypothetical protein
MKANIRKVAIFLYDIFLHHPNQSGMGYLRHFFKTMKMSYQMGVAAIVLIIHAFFPKYFESFGETTIERLSMEHLSNELAESGQCFKCFEQNNGCFKRNG